MSELQTPDEGTEPQDVTPETVTEPVAPSTEVQEPVVEPTDEPTPEPVESVEPTDPDYKQKFVDSQREAILLAERNKIKDAQIEKLTKTDTPTDEAMRLVYPDWDDYNEITKKAFIKSEAQEMRQRRMDAELSELREEKRLNAELESVIESTPKLEGKETAFRKFAANPKNKGISVETLAKAFLFDVEAPAAPASKGEALPTGNGGPRGDLKPKKISIEEAAEIRKTDYKRWKELLDADMIEEIE